MRSEAINSSEDEESTITNKDVQRISPKKVSDQSFSFDLEVEEVLLCVFWRSGKLGAAYYTVQTSEVSLLYDIVDVNPDFNITKSFVNQVQPSQILTSERLSETFVSALRTLVGNDNSEGVNREYHLHVLPGKDFKYEACRSRVLDLHLPGVTLNNDKDAQHTHVHSIVDMTAESTIYALGGLLRFLDHHWCGINFDLADKNPPILAINVISLDDLVFMDQGSFSALQVFCPQHQSSGFQKWSTHGTKESFSLFNLFNRCRSTIGCKWMRTMFLHPSRDAKVLNDRLDVVEFCVKQRNVEVLQRILEELKHIKSVNGIITKLQAAQASVREWTTLYKTIHHAVLVGELCATQKEEVSFFRQISDCLTDELYQVAQSINTFMDFDESETQNRFVVKPGIDPELDCKKQRYAGLAELLSAVAQQELAALPPYIPQCSVIYIPEIGFVLGLPLWQEELEEDDLQLPGVEFIIWKEEIDIISELDQVLGDSLVNISEHEIRIMLRLVKFIQTKLQPITRIINFLAQLDCLAAIASVAKEHNYIRPELVEERYLDIQKGRHPLHELCVSEFVANDTNYFGGGVHILTAPNASGKSVHLKQVALIVYLAHIGSFVPARSAKIGLIDKMFTRIHTNESVSTRLSAFMIDLRQISLALTNSSSRSLLLVDEFGKGSSELDGLSLLAACLSSLLERGPELCPMAIISTHFQGVIELLPASPLLCLQSLEHMYDEEGQIVHLYRLRSGHVNSSFAHQVAQNQGLALPIIQRSLQVLESLQNNIAVDRIFNKSSSRQISKYESLGRNFLLQDLSDESTCQTILHNIIQNVV